VVKPNYRRVSQVQLEVGVNTRHFSAASAAKGEAFRTTGETDTSFTGGEAVSSSIRFTERTRWDTFVGIEGEAGALIGYPGSNLAGAYGVGGVRKDVGRLRIAAELVGGRRWVRYANDLSRMDPGAWIAEPRVRGDIWLGSRVTLGGAAGATLGDSSVWMAGVYVGVTSSDFGR
jgi:hypothetical protein